MFSTFIFLSFSKKIAVQIKYGGKVFTVLINEAVNDKINSLGRYIAVFHLCRPQMLNNGTYNMTKCMLFNTQGRLIQHKFNIDGHIIENVRNYCYLGVNFTVSRSFSVARTEIYKKGLKAFSNSAKVLMIKTIYKDISPYILTYSQSSFNVWF
jgi:hypothetical protein